MAKSELTINVTDVLVEAFEKKGIPIVTEEDGSRWLSVDELWRILPSTELKIEVADA